MDQETDDLNEQHRQRMARLKEAHDSRLASATREKGLIVVNTGAGKGKSSASFGLVARRLATGCGSELSSSSRERLPPARRRSSANWARR